MADTVTGPTILQQNDNRVVIKIVNQSDRYRRNYSFWQDVSALLLLDLMERSSSLRIT